MEPQQQKKINKKAETKQTEQMQGSPANSRQRKQKSICDTSQFQSRIEKKKASDRWQKLCKVSTLLMLFSSRITEKLGGHSSNINSITSRWSFNASLIIFSMFRIIAIFWHAVSGYLISLTPAACINAQHVWGEYKSIVITYKIISKALNILSLLLSYWEAK